MDNTSLLKAIRFFKQLDKGFHLGIELERDVVVDHRVDVRRTRSPRVTKRVFRFKQGYARFEDVWTI